MPFFSLRLMPWLFFRVGCREVLEAVVFSCNTIQGATARLCRVSKAQARWAMQEIRRVAELGLEHGCSAEVVACRIAQRARQISESTRMTVAEMRIVEEGLRMLDEAGQVLHEDPPEGE